MDKGTECSVQVVCVSTADTATTYQLDEQALAALLLSEDVADCRVALVSVAGAYRGGKSFLLDFLLRYLSAEEAQRLDGAWLGAEREELCGFNWRGGSERDTTGLWLWSRPVRLQLPSGESVAVLLMDTQGTFDCRSTVKDCSTIFALSTLLSSVQIYNLKENIREDDLQHLQLFTEYGRMVLASNEGSKPFQSLNFLIRDWSYDYQYPFGAEGGEQLLEKRLKIEEEQASELQEVRQHIRECFDTVGCFLMPHPGFDVFDPNFKGCLSDVRKQFKKSLLEFVPFIFGSRYLKPKQINGEIVTGRDLFHYFRNYVEIFNSDALPVPQTIVRATAEAALSSAVESTRMQYNEAMEKTCGWNKPSMPFEMLQIRHQTARDTAIRAFGNRGNLGNRQASRSTLLSMELDERLEHYKLINEAECQRAIADAKKLYEERIQSKVSEEYLCLHPMDLEEIQRNAFEDAVALYDSKRLNEGAEDKEKKLLVQDLNSRYRSIRILNEMNNKAAVVEAREAYSSFMVTECGDQPCMNVKELELKHEKGKTTAIALFESKRNRLCKHNGDTYKIQLIEYIIEKYNRIKGLNESNNDSAVQAAIFHYNGIIGSICAQHLPCLHPDSLRQEHQNIREQALNEFYSRRNGDNNDKDEYVARIDEELSRSYQTLDEMNERKNQLAINNGYEIYCDAMNARVRPNRLQLTPGEMEETHSLAVTQALQSFRVERRHRELRDVDDGHKDSLIQRTEERFIYYRVANERNPLNVTNILLASCGVGAVILGGVAVVMTGGAAAVASAGGVVELTQAGTLVGIAVAAGNFLEGVARRFL